MTAALEAAMDYHGRGLPITLCSRSGNGKSPLGEGWSAIDAGKNWQNKEWTLPEIGLAFRELGELNVGCLWGARSKMIDIEVDSPDDNLALTELFDGTDPPVTPTFQSKRGPHRLFAWHPDLDRIGKAMVVYKGLEIRIGADGKGAHSLLPPSTTDGVIREWLVTFDECDPAPLPDAVIHRIISSRIQTERCVDLRGISAQRQCQTQANTLHVSHDLIDAAILRTLPNRVGQRNRRIFDFSRELKAIFPSDTPVSDLVSYVKLWHAKALPYIGTKPFEETWFDFGAAWRKRQTPAGRQPIVSAFELAQAADLPEMAKEFDQQPLRLLMALCRELQREAGSRPFFLACRAAAKLLGVHHATTARWLNGLCRVGVLRLESEGNHDKRQARCYRYLLDL